MTASNQHSRDYLERTIETVRNHRTADNSWPQWANAFADEIERLWGIEEQFELLRGIAADWLIGEHYASGRSGTTKEKALVLIDEELARSAPTMRVDAMGEGDWNITPPEQNPATKAAGGWCDKHGGYLGSRCAPCALEPDPASEPNA